MPDLFPRAPAPVADQVQPEQGGRNVGWPDPQFGAVFVAHGAAQLAQGLRVDLVLRRNQQQEQRATIGFARGRILALIQAAGNPL